MATGDVLLHPQLLAEAKTSTGYDFQPLLNGLQPYVQDADVALWNLETPIGVPPYSGYPTFSVPAQIVADLASIGYDGCTTATNHTVDIGTAGVKRTLDTLEKYKLFATGSYRTQTEAQAPPLLQAEGIKLGVIASTYSLNGMRADTDWRVDTGVDAKKLITRAKAAQKSGAEIVVAAIHDGTGYSTRPSDAQRKLGQTLAESGAFDFIYMHHTHSVLPIEKHEGTWIVYGLGNSVAKHATPRILCREGISIKATFMSPGKDQWKVGGAGLGSTSAELLTGQMVSGIHRRCLPACGRCQSLAGTHQQNRQRLWRLRRWPATLGTGLGPAHRPRRPRTIGRKHGSRPGQTLR